MVTQVPILKEHAINKLIQSQEEMKQGNKMKQRDFWLGQQVLIKKETFFPWKKELEQKWEGPFEIAEILSYRTYRIRNHLRVQAKPINGNRLKPYHNRLYLQPIIMIEN